MLTLLSPSSKVGRQDAHTAATVRIELLAGSARVELHWPVANARELAAWLREVGR